MSNFTSKLRFNTSYFAEKILSKKWVAIVCIISLIFTCSFLLLLTVYYPRDNTIKIESLSQITNFKNIQTKNKLAVNNLGLFLLTKEIANGGIGVTQIDEQTVENWAFGYKGVVYINYPTDLWLSIKANENPDLPKLAVFDNIPNKLNTQNPVDVSFDTTLKTNYKEIVYNYHILNDTENMRNITQQIMNFLIKIDKNNQQIYFQNTRKVLEKITNLEQKYLKLSSCKVKLLMTSQEMQYLIDQNQLDAIYLTGFNTQKYSTKQIKLIKSVASNLKTNSIYITQSLDKQELNLLKNDLELNVVYLDSLVNDTENRPNKTKSIFEIMEKNLESIQITADCN